jgi:hypothetical protein
MESPYPKVVLLAIGKKKHQDHALGIEFLKSYCTENLRNAICLERKKLKKEDIENIQQGDILIFISAIKDMPGNIFIFESCIPARVKKSQPGYLPENLIFDLRKIYGKTPEAYHLKIQGYQWRPGRGISPAAKKNLKITLNAFPKIINSILNKKAVS